MRKTILALLLAALLTALLTPALAADEKSFQKVLTGYEAVISDGAGLLTDREISSVQLSMYPITEYANVGFVTYDASGSDGRSVLTKAKIWGDARFGSSSPYAVFMIDMKTRRLGIYSSKAVYSVLSTAKANTITDNVYTYATRGEYAECAKEAFREILQVMEGQTINESMKIISNVFLALICAILVTYMLIVGRMRNEQETTMQTMTKVVGAGAATAVTAHTLRRVVHHEHSSGGGHGGGGFGGGGGGGGGGSHGF